MKQQSSTLQRSKWTAQVGLVLHSQVPSPLTGYVLPEGALLSSSCSRLHIHFQLIFAPTPCRPEQTREQICTQ